MIALAVWRGLDTLPGKAALVVAALLVGALLALVGQVYQTGADRFELFAAWAVAIVAWVLVARMPRAHGARRRHARRGHVPPPRHRRAARR
ncbi:MAG: DUF2157 domain-containing protein [Casimicrobiaceae bacterium]